MVCLPGLYHPAVGLTREAVRKRGGDGRRRETPGGNGRSWEETGGNWEKMEKPGDAGRKREERGEDMERQSRRKPVIARPQRGRGNPFLRPYLPGRLACPLADMRAFLPCDDAGGRRLAASGRDGNRTGAFRLRATPFLLADKERDPPEATLVPAAAGDPFPPRSRRDLRTVAPLRRWNRPETPERNNAGDGQKPVPGAESRKSYPIFSASCSWAGLPGK